MQVRVTDLFPQLKLIVGSSNSLSQAQRIKEDNKNKSEKILSDLHNVDLYNEVETVYTSNGITENIEKVDRVKPWDFDKLSDVAEKFAQSALLGYGIKTISNVREKLETMDIRILANKLGIELPEQPTKQLVCPEGINWYTDQNQVEVLFENLHPTLIEQYIEHFPNALLKESSAAVYGKIVVNKSGFFRRLSKATKSIDGCSTTNQTIIIKNKQVLAYDKSEFEDKDNMLMNEYTNFQTSRNGIVKQLKDEMRELQVQFDSEYSLKLQEYNSKVKEIYAEVEGQRSKLLKELASLKIR